MVKLRTLVAVCVALTTAPLATKLGADETMKEDLVGCSWGTTVYTLVSPPSLLRDHKSEREVGLSPSPCSTKQRELLSGIIRRDSPRGVDAKK
jgi:hypothetical protein